jgi:hypothetical protein
MTTAKRTSLLGLLLVIVGALTIGIGASLDSAEKTKIALLIVGPLVFGAGFIVAVRTSYGSCGHRLSSMFPSGSLLLLWAAKQKCRDCRQWL